MNVLHLFRYCALLILGITFLSSCSKTKDTPLPQRHTVSDLKIELDISAEKEVSAVFNVITPNTVIPNLIRDGVAVTPEIYSSQWESFITKSTTFSHRGLGLTCTMTFVNADENSILSQNKVSIKVRLWQDNKLKSEFLKEVPLKDGSTEPIQIELWSEK